MRASPCSTAARSRKVFDQGAQPSVCRWMTLTNSAALFRITQAAIAERLGVSLDGGERRAKLVRHVGDELPSHPFQPLQLGDVTRGRRRTKAEGAQPPSRWIEEG